MVKIVKLLYLLILFVFCVYFPVATYAYDPLITENNIYGIGIINHSDLKDVANLVNVNGGDWGYVTVVITQKEMDKHIWQRFLDDCRRYHLIPIIRVATNFDGKNWEIPKVETIDQWVNFFNSLNWVIENRYIIIGNEPNHAKEWGGKIEPEAYAMYLKTFSDRLKNANKDYFVLNAGFDQAASNTKNTMDQKLFMQRMVKEVPDVFEFIDGWASHSYPNPAFSGPKTGTGKKSIRGYEWELGLIKKDLPVFITETGWFRLNTKDERLTATNLKYAYESVWSKDKRIVAVTPFILNYESEPFYEFSWKKSDTEFFPIYTEIQNINKTKGKPIQHIDGEILFKFLNPLGRSGSFRKGYSIVKNTGQNIWDKNNVKLTLNNQNILVKDIQISTINPFSTGLIIYTIQTQEIAETFNLKVGFFVEDKKIGDLYSGKIITLP